MAFPKGISGTLAGRKLGIPNKAAAARKTITAALAGATPGKPPTHLDTLTGKGFIDACVKLTEFVSPKLQRTALATNETNSRIEVTMNLGNARQSLLDRLLAMKGAIAHE